MPVQGVRSRINILILGSKNWLIKWISQIRAQRVVGEHFYDKTQRAKFSHVQSYSESRVVKFDYEIFGDNKPFLCFSSLPLELQ